MQPSTSNASENNASDSDNLADKDKTLCIQCHAQRAEPYFRYCLRCFKVNLYFHINVLNFAILLISV